MHTLFLNVNEPGAVETAGGILRCGGLVAIPTETVYGLAANALDGAAAASIFAAKGRPADNPLIVHICEFSQIYGLVSQVPEAAVRLAEAYWPGPLTMILPKADCIPDAVSAGLSTVGIRFPSHPAAQAVIRAAGCPLAAPSANLSGKPSPTTAQHVMEDMDGRIDAVLDGGPCEVGVESTVITLATPVPRLLRPGGITLEQLEAVLGKVDVDPAVLDRLAEGAKAASPGMKYKHYAPRADVTLLNGTCAQFVAYVNAHAGEGVAALCYDEEKDSLQVPAIPCGSEKDMVAQAHSLFDALRRVDDELHARVVYAHCPTVEGVGLAVYNRLLRAAAFRRIDLTPGVVGLTGPTGGGKSTVCKHLRMLGCGIVDSDAIAREAVQDKDVLAMLCRDFGEDILQPDGTLDRRKLANRAFASPEATKRLNAATHPWIVRRIGQLLEQMKMEAYPALCLDASQLFEAHAETLCDEVWVVTAPQEERLARICARDSISAEEGRRRMRAQLSDAFFAEHANRLIVNTDAKAACQQAEAFLEAFLACRRKTD